MDLGGLCLCLVSLTFRGTILVVVVLCGSSTAGGSGLSGRSSRSSRSGSGSTSTSSLVCSTSSSTLLNHDAVTEPSSSGKADQAEVTTGTTGTLGTGGEGNSEGLRPYIRRVL